MELSDKLKIRDARPEDAPFIAWAVLTAMDFEEGTEEFDSILKRIRITASEEDTLYSWKHTRIAVINSTVVGCLVSYDGAVYEKMWRKTWRGFSEEDNQYPEEYLKKNAIETKEGEYYLDSMAIKKPFRGYGIGHILLEDGIRKARRHGFSRVTLIADATAPKLRQYYGELGFKDSETISFFGDDYTRMILDL